MKFGRMIERVVVLTVKEFRELLRDPKMRAFMFGAPVLQLMILGYAVSTDVRNTPTIVVDRDHTPASRAVVEAFVASGRFRVVEWTDRAGDVRDALDDGRAAVAIEIPVGFSRDLQLGTASMQLLFDGTNSNQATIAKSYAERIALNFGVAKSGLTIRPPVDLRERAWFNPSLESRIYNVPAVLGVIVYFVCLIVTSLAVVREREVGTLEQLMVSPLQPLELVAGKSLPVAIIGLLDVVIVTVVAVVWFHVPFRGSALHLLFATGLYLMSGIGIGLLLSTISETQQEAFMGTILIFMPSLLLSGFMFPVRSMPRFFQIVTLANPVRHFAKVVRAIFLKGVSPAAVWQEELTLFVIGTAVLVFAASRFHKRMA